MWVHQYIFYSLEFSCGLLMFKLLEHSFFCSDVLYNSNVIEVVL